MSILKYLKQYKLIFLYFVIQFLCFATIICELEHLEASLFIVKILYFSLSYYFLNILIRISEYKEE